MKVDRLVSKWDWFKEQHGFCWLCGMPMTFKYDRNDRLCATFGHIIPVTEGGTWAPQNLLLAHQDCHSRRGNHRHIFCVPAPHAPRTFKTNLHWSREIRPARATVYRAWTRLWMIDKGLMKA